jgi:D-alanyl-lipoteichoic acid acyltransferase DltB (MBOAT superfamily)
MGFIFPQNFRSPYRATGFRDFWRRWHMTLSRFLRDFLYIPLGGNRKGRTRTYVNLMATMVLGGLWHGAAWNFVLWGAWHGAALVAERALGAQFKIQNAKSKILGAAGWLVTMFVVFYGWLLFRAGSWHQVSAMTRALTNLGTPPWLGSFALNLAVFATPLVAMEAWQLRARNRLAPLALAGWARALLQGALLAGIVVFWSRARTPFIYFQF